MLRPSAEAICLGILGVEGLAAAVLGAVIWHTDHLPAPAATWAVTGHARPSASAPQPVPTATVVPSAPPLRLSVPALRIDSEVSPYTVAEAARGVDGLTGAPCLAGGVIRCVDPASPSSVVWQVGGTAGVAFGSEAGTDSEGTVYLYGHAGAGNDAVFSDIGQLKPGDEAAVTTANGKLTYRVQRTVSTAKSAFASTPEAVDQVPGRLLLISCDHSAGATLSHGGYSTDNVVVVLQREAG